MTTLKRLRSAECSRRHTAHDCSISAYAWPRLPGSAAAGSKRVGTLAFFAPDSYGGFEDDSEPA